MRLYRSRAAIAVLALSLVSTAYGPCKKSALSTVDGVAAVEAKLNQAANALNALAKTNRELYRKNTINLAQRQRAASLINKSNAALDKVVDRVFAIDPTKPDSIASGKIDVQALLLVVSSELGQIDFGPEKLRLAVQVVVAIINEALDLTRRVKEIR